MTRLEEYLNTRLANIGLSAAENKRTLYYSGQPKEVPIIGLNERKQAITLPYCSPNGEVATYEYEGRQIPFERLRYMEPQEYEDKDGKKKTMRYSQPPKTGVYTYMTPGIVRRYRLAEKIKTLFIVEGEIKALSGDVLGLPMIGIGGIQNIKDKENNTIDDYIRMIINRCKPDNVALLFDADLLDVKYSEDKDLSTRLQNFCSAVINFMEYMKPFDVDLYFSHIATKYSESAKGLDDLIATLKPKKKTKLVEELNDLISGRKDFINCMALSPGIKYKLEKYFFLDNVANFYENYKAILEDRIFKWKGSSYYFDGSKVVRDNLTKAKMFIKVADQYYRKCIVFDDDHDKEHKQPIMKLVRYNEGTVKQEVKDISLIPRYQMFFNEPENTNKYRRIKREVFEGIETVSYNRYNPVYHDIKPGSWKTIESFLRHIFSDTNLAGEKMYEFGLDYIQHTFFEPRKKMPVLCFVSKERNTGKSTFLYLMRAIFQENVIVVDSDRLNSQFSGVYSDKLIVGIEEAFVSEKRTEIKEKIKNWATNPNMLMEQKGKDASEIKNYMHIIVCSNNETNFMQIDEGENRYAVLKVGVLEKDDPFIMSKMEKEIGAFLYYLSKREYHYECGESRMGFNPEVYMTESLIRVQERTENKAVKEIKDFIRQSFIDYEAVELYYSPKDLAIEINQVGGFTISKSTIIDFLKYDLNMRPEPITRYDYYVMKMDPNTGTIRPEKGGTKTGRPYKFIRKDFIKEE